MRMIAAAGLVGACLATSPLYAADLFGSAPPDFPDQANQTELGSNWYIRGDVGYGRTTQDTVVVDPGTSPLFPSVGNQPVGNAADPMPPPRGNALTTPGAVFGLGFGYRVNDWFRAEADWQFSRGPGLGTQNSNIYCPEVAVAVPTGATNPVGYAYDFTQCTGSLNVSQYNNTGLAMGYVDLGHWGMFTPFLGAGAGMNVNTITGTLNYHQNDTGVSYSGTASSTAAPGIWVVNTPTGYETIAQWAASKGIASHGNPQGIGPQDWTRKLASTKWTFAAAAAAGLGIKISQSATLDIAYKLLSLDVTGGVKGLQQDVTVGVRYNIN